jgi:hypothetical protein
MFTRLRIENFKAWRDTGDIRLAPLTVFFGPNSSGKTSLLQFLLLLKQTMESPDRKQVLNFGGSHSYIDFGGWSDTVFGGEPTTALRFAFEWKVPNAPRAEDRERGALDAALMTFGAEIGPTSSAPISVREFRYTVAQSPILAPLWVEIRHNPGTRSYELSSSVRAVGQQVLPTPRRFYGLPKRLVVAPVVGDLEFQLEQQFDSMHYLGPLRKASGRSYVWSGESPADVGFSGENTVPALLAAWARVLRLAEDEHIHFGELLATWLVRVGLLESFKAESIGAESSHYRVMVRTPGSRRQVNLADVGFGVSQVLPVLVQLLYAEPDTTLMFEQPEIHLHPRIQAELADVFIEAIQMQQDDRARGIQCLVESHSEHFLRRLQRRIAEGKLAPNQTALYFCEPGPDGSTIKELKIDEDGNITNWPENFFGDEVGDLAAMTEAAMKRQLGSEEG